MQMRCGDDGFAACLSQLLSVGNIHRQVQIDLSTLQTSSSLFVLRRRLYPENLVSVRVTYTSSVGECASQSGAAWMSDPYFAGEL
jgi:hypothetical protein